MALTDWDIVRRSMNARLFSTVTTIVTVGIAVGLMTLLVSMKSSGRQAFERGTGNAQMMISRDPSALTAVLNNMFYMDVPGTPIGWSDFEELKEAYPFAWCEPTVLGDSYLGHPVMGVEQSFFVNFFPVVDEPFAMKGGRGGELGRIFSDDFELVLGSQSAKATGLSVGDVVSIAHGAPRKPGGHHHDEYEYTVVGILESTGSAHDRTMFSTIGSAWILHAHDRVVSQGGDSHVLITRADLLDEDRKITGVYASLGHRKAALAQILSAIRKDSDWTVAQPADTVRRLFSIVSNIDQLLIAMGVAVLLSSGVSIMVALYNSMQQRRRQIAVLRVLGATRLRVFQLVLVESAMIGLFGGIVGVLIGIAGGKLTAGVLEERVGLVIEPSLPVDGYLWMVVMTIVLSAAAGIVPAVMAYRTSVVRSLRPMG